MCSQVHVCHKCFWTAQRLQQHIRYSRRYSDGCFWWLQRYVHPQTSSSPISLPDVFRGQHRLPWILASGPHPAPPISLWEQHHDALWNQWRAEWAAAGFADDIDEVLCANVHEAMTACARQWADSAPHDQDLAYLWSCVVHDFACGDAQKEMHAIWAFGLWGRSCLYDLLDTIEDPDCQQAIEKVYLDMMDDLPVSGLLDRLERLHRAVPPDDLCIAPPVHADQRVSVPLEPFDQLFDAMEEGLRPFVGAIQWLIGPSNKAFPFVAAVMDVLSCTSATFFQAEGGMAIVISGLNNCNRTTSRTLTSYCCR